MRFDELVECLEHELKYRRSLEKELQEMTEERNRWRELAEPGWDERERKMALDTEIRLMRQ